MTINSNGSLSGPNWSINSNGDAEFNNIRITSSSYSRPNQNLIDYGNGFYITGAGKLNANEANVGGTIRASGGNISGWTINDYGIRNSSGNSWIYSDGRIRIVGSNSYLNAGTSLAVLSSTNGLFLGGNSASYGSPGTGNVQIDGNTIYINGLLTDNGGSNGGGSFLCTGSTTIRQLAQACNRLALISSNPQIIDDLTSVTDYGTGY